MPRPLLQILLAIAIGLAATYYWDPRPATTPDADTTARQLELPKTYLQNTRSWSYGEEGDLRDILEAQSVEHFPQNNESLINAPRFYSHSGDDKTWSATADRGRFLHAGQRLLLRRDVVMTHDQTGARLDTQGLDIYLKKKLAVSRREVLLTQDNNRTRADGMQANLIDETISLGPNVESTYVPAPR